MNQSLQEKLEDYDSEPVVYCPRCYSLKIKYVEAIGSDCCMDCGCTDSIETSIGEWEKLYEKRYGRKFIQGKKNLKGHPIFKTSISKLKTMVLNNPSYKNIIRTLYPKFPSGLGRTDAVLMLFDKLSKDNRMDELRTLLLNSY